jgi:hypothetical protein
LALRDQLLALVIGHLKKNCENFDNHEKFVPIFDVCPKSNG